MALRNIVVEGDEILQKKCREVVSITDRTKETLSDMVDTMRNVMGVGLAAPQIGIMRRMFVAEPEEGRLYYMINPVILEQSGSSIGYEGCLSIPGMMGEVERPEHIKMQALDLDGNMQVYEFDDFDARVMCHEYDHLEGILYRQKATTMTEAIDPEENEEEIE